MTINIDFDGTCVSHEFPRIGKDIGAQRILKKLTDNGHQLILFTMRSDRLKKGRTGDKMIKDVTGSFLTDAVNWFKENDIPLYGIQYNPTQSNWTTSNKAFGNFYIDDAAIGCPLILDNEISDRPFVDWKLIEIELIKKGILN